MQTVLDAAIGRMFPPAFAEANAGVVAERKRRLGAVDAGCFAQACLGLAQLDLTAQLPGVRNKTLVMCGALDQTTPPALAREVAAGIPGATYRDIDGSGHCPMLEQPKVLVEYMQGVSGCGLTPRRSTGRDTRPVAHAQNRAAFQE